MKTEKRILRRFFRSLIIAMVMLSAMTTAVFAYDTKTAYFNKGYKKSGSYSQDIVAIAKAQTGKTKVQLHYAEAWCVDFVLDCAKLAGIPDSIIPNGKKTYGNAGTLYNLLMKAGGRRTTSPVKGDLVFYYCSSSGKYVHAGIYEGGGYAIEGNVSGKVLRYKPKNYIDSHGHSVASGTVKTIYVEPDYKEISRCAIQAPAVTYRGKDTRTNVSVSYRNQKLTSADYSVSYSGNSAAGTGRVTITGKGRFRGSVTKTYTISRADIKGLGLYMTNSQKYRTYTGKAVRTSFILWNASGQLLRSGTDYTVRYSNNKKIGSAKITVTGKGNYTGTRAVSFVIVPKQVAKPSVSTKVRGFTVRFKAPAGGASGYRISYKRHSSSAWTHVYVKASATTVTLRKLSAFAVYDVKVTAFVTVGKTRYFGTESKSASVLTL